MVINLNLIFASNSHFENFDKLQHFHEFFTKNFLTIFLVKSKLSTAKKFKTTTFSRVLHTKKSSIFSGNQSWFFWQKWRFRTVCLNGVWKFHSSFFWGYLLVFLRVFYMQDYYKNSADEKTVGLASHWYFRMNELQHFT